jgi:hypothetical protein
MDDDHHLLLKDLQVPTFLIYDLPTQALHKRRIPKPQKKKKKKTLDLSLIMLSNLLLLLPQGVDPNHSLQCLINTQSSLTING